jgi:arginyl-tRNA synthetase
MPTVPDILAAAVERALGAPAIIKPCADQKFGDYQANGVMAVAKQRGENPRSLAEKVVARLKLDDICEPPTVAGAGFINFRLKPDFVAQQVTAAARDERLGVPAGAKPKTIVIDFSSPNVAKPMHVGHIRSTIIGDCLARVLRFLGHRVITDNHIGDWGTQFGMLLYGWNHYRKEEALARDPIAELERMYKKVYDETQRSLDVLDEAKCELVKLQQGDSRNRAIWQKIIDLSRQEFDRVYERLDVTFDHTLGESEYNSMLPEVVQALRKIKLAEESEGAMVVFLDGFQNPVLIQKADYGYLYATTDLATIQYRIKQWQPDEIVYVTDARQQVHFQQLFSLAKLWEAAARGGLLELEDGSKAKLPVFKHVSFGSILGEDGKPLKTREGAPVKLADLLDEAEKRALAIVTEKNPELPAETRKQIAQAVGIGAVKYADLSQNRTTDYVFSWSKMLAMTGNTAPYMQYAYVRVQSIFRKAGAAAATAAPVSLEHPAELDLAKHLLRFAETLQSVAEDDKPNWLTSYLYDLAGKFSVFYDNCPVLQSAEPTRSSRLTLCRLTADVIKRGLKLLGIDVIEQM